MPAHAPRATGCSLGRTSGSARPTGSTPDARSADALRRQRQCQRPTAVPPCVRGCWPLLTTDESQTVSQLAEAVDASTDTVRGLLSDMRLKGIAESELVRGAPGNKARWRRVG